MPTFDYMFTVDAPLTTVSQFHHDTSVLKILTPPPIFAQVHEYEPLGEGSLAKFTLWFGPLPVHWTAVHSDVNINGFTDTQLEGPLKFWQHTHRFTAVSPTMTQIHEHIEYEHDSGPRGLLSHLLFARPGLYFLFTARKLITRRHLKNVSMTDVPGTK